MKHIVILDPEEAAAYKRGDHTYFISGTQIKQRASKYRDPVRLSPTTVIGITEDDRPYLEWEDQ